MTVIQGVFYLIVGLLACILSESAGLETVWLKESTSRLKIDKRTLSDSIDLPDELTFNLRRGSNDITLNLKRNYDIDPNADVFFLRTLKDGRSILVKTQNLENEDVAYYQDRDNEAVMTVRCDKLSTGQCNRAIYGNIRIGHRIYDLRPAEIDVKSRDSSDLPDILGKRYILQEEEHIRGHNLATHKDTIRESEKKAEEGLKAPLRRFDGKHTQNNIYSEGDTLSSREMPAFYNRWKTDENSYSEQTKNNDQTRQLRKSYDVEVAVLIDESIWSLYSSLVHTLNPASLVSRVKRKITEAFSHTMNGVNLRYKTIEDPEISISVKLRDFIFFQDDRHFPTHNEMMVNGTKYTEARTYLFDIADWDDRFGVNRLPVYDHGMLFTSHKLYLNCSNQRISGLTFTGEVCNPGSRMSIIQLEDYVSTVWTAAHELGHSLGANHDGEKNAVACKSEDLFIMTNYMPSSNRAKPYSRNRFIFSNCSVKAFKDTLENKLCVNKNGSYFNEQEYNGYIIKQPGEVYSPYEQCHVIIGPNSLLCETVPADMCLFMRCTDPKTGICIDRYFGAARGTECGRDKWCIEGRCVPKLPSPL